MTSLDKKEKYINLFLFVRKQTTKVLKIHRIIGFFRIINVL